MTELRQIGPGELVVAAAAGWEQLQVPGVEVTRTGLIFRDPDLPLEAWEQIFGFAAYLHSWAKFAVADALNYADKAYGEKYAQAIDTTGLSEQTLTNWAYVGRQVVRSRRRENLRFSHHAEVASLEPDEQVEWLDRTEANGWSVADLRDHLREERGRSAPQTGPRWTRDEPVTLARSPDDVDEAAAYAEKTLSASLPDGHPLWKTTAETNARDVLALAPAAREALTFERGRLLEQTRGGLLAAAARRVVESRVGFHPEQGGFEGQVMVEEAALDEMAALLDVEE